MSETEVDEELAAVSIFLRDTLDIIDTRQSMTAWISVTPEAIEAADQEVEHRLKILAEVLCKRVGLKLQEGKRK